MALPYVHVGEKEEKHKWGESQPAVDNTVAFEFVQDDEDDCHDDHDWNEYWCIGDRHPEFGAIWLLVLIERRVNSVVKEKNIKR